MSRDLIGGSVHTAHDDKGLADKQHLDTPKEQTVADTALKSPKDRTAAQESFKEQLRKKVAWIAEDCYESNLLVALRGLSEILQAGKDLGVSEGKPFPFLNTANDPHKTLHPLKVLGIKKQVKDRLLDYLEAQGVDMVTIFNWEPKTSKD